MELHQVYTVDLTQIQGDTDFLCPQCGLLLSPDGETEGNYCALGTTVINNILEDLVTQCIVAEAKLGQLGSLH